MSKNYVAADVSPLTYPVKNSEPTHVGCYNLTS
jgi:hypothetical protein